MWGCKGVLICKFNLETVFGRQKRVYTSECLLGYIQLGSFPSSLIGHAKHDAARTGSELFVNLANQTLVGLLPVFTTYVLVQYRNEVSDQGRSDRSSCGAVQRHNMGRMRLVKARTLIRVDFWVPIQAKAEEREEECALIGIAGTPISRHLQKGKQNHRERQTEHLHITITELLETPPKQGASSKRAPSIWVWHDTPER